jgi:cellulose synthase/poly-beta-1,6-N-acetylglucosamine synthase-like glycosyltransferase
LKPDYCVLLDVGTKPRKRGILNLLKGFSAGDDIGGVTGFMNVNSSFKSLEGDKNSNQAKEPNCCVKNFFSIERAQEYEYIIAHFLDKNA